MRRGIMLAGLFIDLPGALEKRSHVITPAGVNCDQLPALCSETSQLLLIPRVLQKFVLPLCSAALNKPGRTHEHEKCNQTHANSRFQLFTPHKNADA